MMIHNCDLGTWGCNSSPGLGLPVSAIFSTVATAVRSLLCWVWATLMYGK